MEDERKDSLVESEPLLKGLDYEELQQLTLRERIWPFMVLTSSFLSFALAAGFNLGIAGAITVAQTKRFNITLEQASWSTSVHTVFFLMISKLMQISIISSCTRYAYPRVKGQDLSFI